MTTTDETAFRSRPDCCAPFRRGFIAEVNTRANLWLSDADAIVEEHPIEAVRLTTWPELKFEYLGGDVPRFAHLPGKAHAKVEVNSYYYRRHWAKKCLESVHPGIKFELPTNIDYPDTPFITAVQS